MLILYDMGKKMKIILIILNLIAAGLVFPAMDILNTIHGQSIQSFYVELDRSQLINQEKVKSYFPEESKNDRRLIPERFMRNRNTKAWILGYPCLLGFLANAVILALWRKPKPDQGAGINSVTSLRDSTP